MVRPELPLRLTEAIAAKRVILFVGAGISMPAPAGLPSWTEFNSSVLACIKYRARRILPLTSHGALDRITLDRDVPVSLFSELIVRNFSAQTYFPILSVLRGAQPNTHHRAIARLLATGRISTVITTNFDTLIETACHQAGISLEVLAESSSFEYAPLQSETSRLLKIHGTATDAGSLVDTIGQKIRGLPPATRAALYRLFASHHLLFLGFSGADLAYDPDYLPLQANRAGGHGFTWVHRPTSERPPVQVGTNDHVLAAELNALFTFLNIGPDNTVPTHPSISPQPLTEAIHEALAKIEEADLSCAGICLALLLETRQLEAAKVVEEALANPLMDALMKPRIGAPIFGLMLQLARGQLLAQDWKQARWWAERIIHLITTQAASKPLLRLDCGHMASAHHLLSLGWRHDDQQLNKDERSRRALQMAHTCASLAGDEQFLASLQLDCARWETDPAQALQRLRPAARIAARTGSIALMTEFAAEEVTQLLAAGEYDAAQEALEQARRWDQLAADPVVRWRFALLRIELHLRRGQPDTGWALFHKLSSDTANIPTLRAGNITLAPRLFRHAPSVFPALHSWAESQGDAPIVEAFAHLIARHAAGEPPFRPTFLPRADGSDAGVVGIRKELLWAEFLHMEENAMRALLRLCSHLHDTGQIEQLADLGLAAKNRARSLGISLAEATAGNYIGIGLEWQGRLAESDAAFREAVALMRPAEDALEGVLCSNWVRALARLDRMEEAFERLDQARAAFRRGRSPLMLHPVASQARLLARTGRPADGIELLQSQIPIVAEFAGRDAAVGLQKLRDQIAAGMVTPSTPIVMVVHAHSFQPPRWPEDRIWIESFPPGLEAARLHAALALSACAAGAVSDALRLNQTAIHHYNDLARSDGVAECMHNEAAFHARRRAWVEAAAAQQAAIPLGVDGLSSADNIQQWCSLAGYQFNAGQYSHAVASARHALDLNRNRPVDLESVRTHGVLVQSLMKLNRPAEVAAALPAALAAVEAFDNPLRQKLLAELHNTARIIKPIIETGKPDL
jgi:tetratricopeptide (TPR) repeat protein